MAAVEAASSDASVFNDETLSESNVIFLRRMMALVHELRTWTLRDETSKMSKIDNLKADLLYLCDLQNVICEYLQHFVAILRRPKSASETQLLQQDGGDTGP